ncbi:MAG: type II toxin-antitoxin system HicB family antitoxin [Candidatus Limnocylindrales bacterium]
MRFDLYLESGPQHRKTWVYVPSLPGCSTVGPTTEGAIEVARSAILERIEFLRRHGETVADPEPIQLIVVEHVIERRVLGFGQQSFPTDREPLTAADAARLLRWAEWSRQELLAAARAQREPLAVKPASGGRSAAAILSHVAGSECAYVSSTLGTLAGANAAVVAVEAAGEDPWEALSAERALVLERLRRMTPEELTRVIERGEGKPPRTATRMLRRLLEHEWEHVLELRARAEG